MKQLFFAVSASLLAVISSPVSAQDDVKKSADKKETQEIIIRKKGEKEMDVTVQIKGNEITVNGKPLIEFKDDEITVNKRKIIVRDGEKSWFGEGDHMGEFSLPRVVDMDAAFLGVTTDKTKEGAKIVSLLGEGAAASAGLQEGDIITWVDDTKVDGPGLLSSIITSKKPKDVVKITYLRNGKEKSTKVILGERGSKTFYSFGGPDGPHKSFNLPNVPQMRDLGSLYGDMAPEIYGENVMGFPRRQKLGLKIQDTEEGNGVKVLDVEDSSAAALAGLKKGDVITEIAGMNVKNTDEVREQLGEIREKSAYNMKARRNGNEMNFEIKIPKKLKTANL